MVFLLNNDYVWRVLPAVFLPQKFAYANVLGVPLHGCHPPEVMNCVIFHIVSYSLHLESFLIDIFISCH